MQKYSEQPESAGAVSSTRLLGDTVEWKSQSGGYYGKVKHGVIVQVVKAGEVPDPGTMRVLGAGFGMPRKHESYLVRVGNIGYWPRVKHLRVVSPNGASQTAAPKTENLNP